MNRICIVSDNILNPKSNTKYFGIIAKLSDFKGYAPNPVALSHDDEVFYVLLESGEFDWYPSYMFTRIY